LGGTFTTSVAARTSNIVWSHSSIEHSSEFCTCQHLPAFQPVAFPTTICSAFCWSLHLVQWQKRFSRSQPPFCLRRRITSICRPLCVQTSFGMFQFEHARSSVSRTSLPMILRLSSQQVSCAPPFPSLYIHRVWSTFALRLRHCRHLPFGDPSCSIRCGGVYPLASFEVSFSTCCVCLAVSLCIPGDARVSQHNLIPVDITMWHRELYVKYEDQCSNHYQYN
jgi:hypothetical protein